MIVFVGNEVRGKWAEEVIESNGEELLYIPARLRVAEQVNDILDISGGCEAMIFDAEQYTEEASEVIQKIQRIQKVNNSKIILFAPGFLPTSALIVEALRVGIRNFILGINMGDQKDQLRKCLNGYYDTHSEEEFGFVDPILETEEIKEVLQLNNIGIAGANARMGTTTQAIQIIKYLMLKGYRACYVEMNNHGWVRNLEDWYDVEKDPILGRITYCNVDLFYDLTKLQTVLRQGYDYYVFDYGTCTDTDFDRTAFLRENCSIFVCGSSPDEMNHTLNLIRSSFYNDVRYLFNFTPVEEQKELVQMMEEKGSNTFFTDYCPDPFSGCNVDLFEQMLPVENMAGEEKKSRKRKGFLGRSRKRKHG